MAKDLLLGSKAQLQNIQAAGSPGRTCKNGDQKREYQRLREAW